MSTERIMAMFRSPGSGKLYKAIEGPYPHLGIIMFKEKGGTDWRAGGRGYGPFGSPEDAEGALRDKAQRFNWEEKSND